MEVTLGGDRLGTGNKMKVELHNYERSTHDLSYLWRSTMSAGTVVPFLSKVALPGDTWDINLDTEILTHPTIGPLFGSFKVQLDVFITPIRIWNGLLQNNKVGLGMKMDKAFLPIATLKAYQHDLYDVADVDNSQINPSCILAYLGIRGIANNDFDPDWTRAFQMVPLLTYWDTIKTYYTNKMEEVGCVIHTGPDTTNAISDILVNGGSIPVPAGVYITSGATVEILGAAALPNLDYIQFTVETGTGARREIFARDLIQQWTNPTPDDWFGVYNDKYGQLVVMGAGYVSNWHPVQIEPRIVQYNLENLDEMREKLLADSNMVAPVNIGVYDIAPYTYVIHEDNNKERMQSQEGLAVKTYQSDLFNNWLNTEYIDGPGGINEITAIDTSSGEFNVDTFILAKKVYDMLNRVAVSGGTYEDWVDVNYTHQRYTRPNSPVYMGGLIKELVFQEVVSNTETSEQPLGTLGGRGKLTSKHKGGSIYIRVDEHSYIQGMISLTPRIDYSQGNEWDIHLRTLDDVHKPALDQIGFQDLITERMAWWDTAVNGSGEPVLRSAGKQPAWIEYMTSVNKTFGNFAIQDNEMFMTLNRRYEKGLTPGNQLTIKDLTTYIDPVKFNQIFAETSLDAQNFWAQVAVNCIVRRKMSAKLMPNL